MGRALFHQQMFAESPVLLIYFPPRRIFHAKGLYGRDDNNRLPINHRARKAQGFFNRHDFHRATSQFERATVGMTRVTKGIRRLVEDGVARYEPEHDSALRVQQFAHR